MKPQWQCKLCKTVVTGTNDLSRDQQRLLDGCAFAVTEGVEVTEIVNRFMEHRCEDGRRGVAEYIGVAPENGENPTTA